MLLSAVNPVCHCTQAEHTCIASACCPHTAPQPVLTKLETITADQFALSHGPHDLHAFVAVTNAQTPPSAVQEKWCMQGELAGHNGSEYSLWFEWCRTAVNGEYNNR